MTWDRVAVGGEGEGAKEKWKFYTHMVNLCGTPLFKTVPHHTI